MAYRGTKSASWRFLTPPIYDSYTVAFVEQPSFHSLDTCEDKWLNNTNAQMNIQSTILPCVK